MQTNSRFAPYRPLLTDNCRSDKHDTLLQIGAGLILGSAVETFHGRPIGKVKDVMINLHSQRVEYVVVDFGGFLGMGGKLFAIPFREFQYDEVAGTFSLGRTKEYFKRQPGFDKTHWPRTNLHTNFDGFDIDFGQPLMQLSY